MGGFPGVEICQQHTCNPVKTCGLKVLYLWVTFMTVVITIIVSALAADGKSHFKLSQNPEPNLGHGLEGLLLPLGQSYRLALGACILASAQKPAVCYLALGRKLQGGGEAFDKGSHLSHLLLGNSHSMQQYQPLMHCFMSKDLSM